MRSHSGETSICASGKKAGDYRNSPLFLQIKEAQASVLEKYLPASEFANHGERVVTGQRLLQSASDIFLGWSKWFCRSKE